MNRITAAPQQFIALTGYAGAGKDVLAAHLIAAGYVRHNYGDGIKDFFNPFALRQETSEQLAQRLLLNLSSDKTEQDIGNFMLRIAEPYEQTGRVISAFTEDRSVKPYVRALLEYGGELIYDEIQRRYNQTLEHLLASGARVVNTRLCQLREAESSRAYGHTVYLVQRNNWAPASDWDAKVVADLLDHGHIHHTIYNDALSAEDWEADSLAWVQRNLLTRSAA